MSNCLTFTTQYKLIPQHSWHLTLKGVDAFLHRDSDYHNCLLMTGQLKYSHCLVYCSTVFEDIHAFLYSGNIKLELSLLLSQSVCWSGSLAIVHNISLSLVHLFIHALIYSFIHWLIHSFFSFIPVLSVGRCSICYFICKHEPKLNHTLFLDIVMLKTFVTTGSQYKELITYPQPGLG